MNRERTGDLPLSFAQQRLWFLDQFEPGSPVHNIPAAVRLIGPLNMTALQQSLNEVVRRHEVLRITFPAAEGQPMQVIAPASTLRQAQGKLLPLPLVDLRELPEAEREAEARRLATAEAQRPFDLARGSLLRTAMLRLDEEEYVLLLTMHHIVSDDWSIAVLFQELSTLYAAFSTGSASPLPELPIQYADFAHRQRQWLQGKVAEKQLAYWKQRLGELPPVLELPTNRPRPTRQTYRGATQSLLLPSSLSASLKALSQQEGVTLFMTLLTAFQTLLHRYTGQDDVIVGTPIAGRNQAETERLIGFFVNTLVLRTDLSGAPTFRELLARVREMVLGAYAHQELPFEKLLEELQPEWAPSHTPLFQVMFQLRHGPEKVLRLPGLSVANFEHDSGVVKFNLTLEIAEIAAGLCCVFAYNTDLFDAATITRMKGHFQILLEGIVADPAQPIATLPLLTEAERQQLLVEWNTDQVEDSVEDEDGKSMFLPQLFEAQVERTPEAVAVVCDGDALTYQELNRRANQLAHYLQTLGVGPDVRVGLCIERSPELVVAILGILKAGGACVPLDPAYPQERLTFMLEDMQAPVILTQERLLKQLSEYRAQTVCLDAGWEMIARERTESLVSNVTSENLAFVFYTSGSTGRPKAVMWPYRKRNSRQSWEQATYQLTEEDRHLLKSPIGFTLLSREVFWPLLTGAQMIIARPGGDQDTAYLVKLIAEYRITIISVVPSMLRVLLEEQGSENCQFLRHVICFGEPLPIDLQERFFARLSAELSVFYGTTEAPSATFWKCKREETQRIVGIGRRLPHKQIYVLDSHLQPVPIGVPGELYIGGRVARGYLNRPELTAEQFIPHPFSAEPGVRLYKTGDLVRYLPDGNIEFFGRTDHQVKIRGVRIELGEIEAVLSQHPAVREAVVLVREDGPAGKHLAAYVVANQQPVLSIHELRSFLKAKLPYYMVPSVFVLLDALPLTPHGKVDRRGLPAPDRSRPEQEEPFVAPRTPVEQALAGIWVEVLRVERVGIHDNFFDLGGHSLLATQVMSRVRTTFQVELPLRCLFEAPTVADLAVAIVQRQAEQTESETLAQMLAELEHSSEDEAQAVLCEKTSSLRQDLRIHHLLAFQAERTPDAIALVAPGRAPLTYSRLFSHVDDIVTTLNTMGIGRNDRVAIVLPNGPEMAVAFLAVAAGATSAPLNPAYRANEFDFYLSDLNAKALIVQSGSDSPARAAAQARGIPIIELSSASEAEAGIFTLTGEARPRPARAGVAQPDDVALVLHTSGTTSRPKIVPLTHTNICTSAHNISLALELGRSDRCLNVMPLFHIHGLIGALLSSLAAGGSVVCTPGFYAPKFFDWLEAFRPTWYTAVPTMQQAILARAQSHHAIIARCPLRFIRSSSSSLPPQVMVELESVFHAPVIESYGMTEASHQMASNPLPPRERKAGSVGVAAGPEVAIMDEAGNVLPAGVTGEIVIRGANVTPGYENNPTANERAFTNGWFRTGDQGFLDTDDYLFITGRLKEIINRGGEKVSPREIDEALMDHPDIRQAVAFAVPHPSLGEDIAAAVVLRNKASVTEPMIREYLFGRLADFKIPSQVLIVDEIPKGATGKIQRLGLAKKFAQQLQREFVAPQSELERMVASIYAEVLGIEQISASDNFFALGGDSLRATQAISRVRAAFQVNLPIATLFRKPTVRELAAEIARSAEAIDQTLIAEILAELGTLSEEDAQRLLAAELGRNPSAQ